MRICDLDYCHSAAPELLVGGAELIQLRGQVISYGEVEGSFSSDGSFKVTHNNETALALDALGFDPDKFNLVSLGVTKDTSVRRGPGGGTHVSSSTSSFVDLSGQPGFFPLPL